jgi:TAP-like protein
VRKLFPHSVLLAEPGGTTHAGSLFGNLCVDNTIANYLASGKLPSRKPNAKWARPASRCPGRPRAPVTLRSPARHPRPCVRHCVST